ncbi:MAG: hypothetical protein AVDCRST_MAG15-2199, partial [uncultured Rubellimicrobium sp.]
AQPSFPSVPDGPASGAGPCRASRRRGGARPLHRGLGAARGHRGLALADPGRDQGPAQAQGQASQGRRGRRV